jgi:hypothetical protein
LIGREPRYRSSMPSISWRSTATISGNCCCRCAGQSRPAVGAARRRDPSIRLKQGEIGPDLFRRACLMGLEGCLVTSRRTGRSRIGSIRRSAGCWINSVEAAGLLAPPSLARPSHRLQRARRARPAYRAQSRNQLWCCWACLVAVWASDAALRYVFMQASANEHVSSHAHSPATRSRRHSRSPRSHMAYFLAVQSR